VDIDYLMDKVHNLIVFKYVEKTTYTDNLALGKDMSLKQYESQSLHKLVEILQRTAGLTIQVLDDTARDHDRYLRIRTDEGQCFDLPYEAKGIVDRRDQLLTFKALHNGTVLITRSMSSAMAEQCRELNIQFIDHAGNCFLRQSGLYVFIVGVKDTTKAEQVATRGLTPAALRVVFAILAQPSILNSNVRRIAEVSLVSHGAAGAALIVLEEIGFFTTAGTGRRVLTTPERWLDAWTEGYLGRIRPKLERHRMSSPASLPATIQRVSPQIREVALGGEAAAAYRDMGLKPGTLTLYIDLNEPNVMRNLVQELKLRRDPEGKIEVVNMFWNANELQSFPTVPDALIYADLVGTGEERTMEIATDLRKEICKYVASEA
jgi:hypothetical protein